MVISDFDPQIDARMSAWIAQRRDLHRHPELGFDLPRTAGVVANELSRLGLEVQTGVGQSGVIGLLEGGAPGPTVLVRADMDALPVHEENEVDYASEIPGHMHACGHDGHTAVALAVAELFSTRREKIAGRIKFVFQPAEEIGRGAKAMIEDGALDDPVPDVALGLHLWNEQPVGTVALIDGPMMAGASDFSIRVSGAGGHGAIPHETHDPILAASHIVTALQSVVSRSINPIDAAVVSVTAFHAGDSCNVIPSTAALSGTLRAFRIPVRDLLVERLMDIASQVAQGLGCRAEVNVEHLTLPVINSPEVNARLHSVFAQVAPHITFLSECQTMAAEDMSYFLDAVPGTFFFVGSSNAERGLDYPHHHPRFDFDETALRLAVTLMTAAVASYVLPEA